MTELIAKLKECLAEVEYYKQLSYGNSEWKLWQNKVRNLLDVYLGRDSEERLQFQGTTMGVYIDDPRAPQVYLADITTYATNLASIIQRLEMKRDVAQAAAPASAVVSLSLSFMHQKIQEVSGSLFASEHYAQAILQAFIAVNSEVKHVSGLNNQDGQPLMDAAFSVGNPKIQLNALSSQSEKDEQVGFMFLYKGAMQGIRNPKAHENVPNPDRARTLEYLAFASLLMRRIDDRVNNDT